MFSDPYATRYQPTSPLSPRLSAGQGFASLPQQTVRPRASHLTQSSRSLRLDLPPYPAAPSRSHTMSPPSGVQSPAILINRGTQPISFESPRLMREKQRELIARAQLSSKLAASPMSIKPDAPRLDPLGDPKGPVTPLALEEQEAMDYFTAAAPGRFSSAISPSPRSSRSSTASATEYKTATKQHKLDLY